MCYLMSEEWINVLDKLPEIGQRVRAIVVKELIYKGNPDNLGHQWCYDSNGEHGIYSWSPRLDERKELP